MKSWNNLYFITGTISLTVTNLPPKFNVKKKSTLYIYPVCCVSLNFVAMSLEKEGSSERESVSGGAGSCSGASLTAAVLTHIHHEDSESSVCSNRESVGDGEGERIGAGGGGEGGEVETHANGEVVLRSPSRALRRRSKHSPSKKRESECIYM